MQSSAVFENQDTHVAKLKELLLTAISNGASDLHLQTGYEPKIRVNGKIENFKNIIFSHDDMLALAKELLRTRFKELIEKKDVDFIYQLSNENRFRVNIFFQKDGISMVFRSILAKPPTIKQLRLPEIVGTIADFERGLVLVSGATGSGKSSTLAAIIDEINSKKAKHIITIEDPIEFLHTNKSSIVNQRNIGEDALSFSKALKASLREDPDVILIGELRDLESIETALLAAETGHLVLATIHTSDCVDTINRIIGMFQVSEQNRIRLSLAYSLKAIISQRLVLDKNNKRLPANEIMFTTARIQEIIRHNKDYELLDAIKDGKKAYGMQSFDDAVLELFFNGLISQEEAVANATSQNNVLLAINGIGTSALGDSNERCDDKILLKLDGE